MILLYYILVTSFYFFLFWKKIIWHPYDITFWKISSSKVFIIFIIFSLHTNNDSVISIWFKTYFNIVFFNWTHGARSLVKASSRVEGSINASIFSSTAWVYFNFTANSISWLSSPPIYHPLLSFFSLQVHVQTDKERRRK